MDEAIKQIGQRLKGLREVLNIDVSEIAELCGISLDHYLKIEAGEADPSVYRLAKISKRFGIDLNVLLFGEEPNASRYFITRRGHGVPTDRAKGYEFKHLAYGFRGRKVEPFITKVDPLPEGTTRNFNSHEGQEFIYVTEGSLQVNLGSKSFTLEPGDSFYFDSTQPHNFMALNQQPVYFLVVII